MSEYPVITTKSYDATRRYEEGTEVYTHKGKFVPLTGLPASYDVGSPIAVVNRPPTPDDPEMELLLVGKEWTTGGLKRHKVLATITNQRRKHPDAKLVVRPPEVLDDLREYCTDVFDPATREMARHAGIIYGLLVYVSLATQEIQVF